MQDLPYLTADVPGVGGVIRQRPEDFFVQEIPAYEPSGEGEHFLVEIQKVGLTTHQAVRAVASALGVPQGDVGYAGLKDKHALTRQVLSVPAKPGVGGTSVDEERIMRMEVEGVVPQWAARHGNKLRPGHLAGNRFAVKIRGVDPLAVVRLRPLLDRLGAEGLPNYYGEQRFGVDAARPTDRLGFALLTDAGAFCDLYLGGDDERADVAEARRRYDAGDHAAALEAWPRNVRPERFVLKRLVRSGEAGKAVKALDKTLRKLFVSAAQSAVFNEVVAGRVRDGLLGTVLAGDVAVKHTDALRTGGMFTVEDPAVEQPRADSWEISPTGPLPGRKVRAASGEAAEREARAMAGLGVGGVAADVFSQSPAAPPGDRRPLRVRPVDTRLASGVDDDGGHITVAFTLPAGAFATVLLRELMKPEAAQAAGTA